MNNYVEKIWLHQLSLNYIIECRGKNGKGLLTLNYVIAKKT